MLFRMISTGLRRSVINTSSRCIRTSSISLGGGHHDHHEPTPVYIPQPASQQRSIFGSEVVPAQYASQPYSPTKDCIQSYAGAGAMVLLTILAIVYYTDLLGMNTVKPKLHQRTFPAPAKEEESEPDPVQESEPVKAEAEPTVKKQLVTDSVEKKSDSEEKLIQDAISESYVEKGDALVSEHSEDTKEGISDTPQSSEHKTSSTQETAKHVEAKPQSEGSEELTKESNEKIPEYVEYLLIGGGAASYYASLAIRARDGNAKVLMISEESLLPYNRPPLSKELWWYGDENSRNSLQYKALSGKTRDIFFESQGFFVKPADLSSTVHGGVSLVKGHRVVKLCPDEKKAFLDDGRIVKYNKCLIATGSRPKKVKELESAGENVNQKVLYFRGVNDYQKLDEICSSAKSVTVIGGGFLGSELAYGIRRKYDSVKVTQVIAEHGNLANILPEYLSKKATESIESCGVSVITNSKVASAHVKGDKIEIEVKSKDLISERVSSDFVLVAVGVEPETSLAEESGLEVDSVLGGVVADAELRVRSGIYAAGDACSFFDKSLGRRRVEHWENAQISGRLAGENMTGAEKAFWYQPSFFTKISPQHHINAVGNTDATLPTVSVFASEAAGTNKTYERGVVFYKGDADRVVGVLLVNVFGASIDVARRLIEEAKSINNYRELAKLFPLYEQPDDQKKDDETGI